MKFKAWLIEHKIRQEEVARVLGISRELVNAKLNGRQEFTLTQVRRLCEYYKISADDFFV